MNYFEKAKAQGVERPFHILLQMEDDLRAEIAHSLGIRLKVKDDPAAQAWEIINRDLLGLQARTHLIVEQLSPFSRNNNWWEIVTRAATWLRVPYYPGMSEKELEKLLFESIAARLVAALSPDELAQIDLRAQNDPVLYNALEATGLSQDAIRLVFSGFWESSLEPKPIFPSMSRGLSALLRHSKQIFTQWASLKPAQRIFKKSEWQLATTLAALYLQSFVEESIEEFQSLRF